jgi:hypothetical protein
MFNMTTAHSQHTNRGNTMCLGREGKIQALLLHAPNPGNGMPKEMTMAELEAEIRAESTREISMAYCVLRKNLRKKRRDERRRKKLN